MTPEAQQKTISYWDRMGRLNLLAGVMGINGLKHNQREQERNQEAESAYVRHTLWGEKQSPDKEADMGDQTILGDVTNPAPIVIQGGGGSSGGNSLLTLALGALLGGGGVALGHFLTTPVGEGKPVTTQPAEFEDTTTTIGLGKLEDYLGASE